MTVFGSFFSKWNLCSLETEAQCDFALGRFLSRGDLARPRGKKGSGSLLVEQGFGRCELKCLY